MDLFNDILGGFIGQLTNLVNPIVGIVVNIPYYITEILNNISTIILYPIQQFFSIVTSDLMFYITPILNIMMGIYLMITYITALLQTVVNTLNNTVWVDIIMLMLTLIFTIRTYNILADIEILGFKLPKFGRGAR